MREVGTDKACGQGVVETNKLHVTGSAKMNLKRTRNRETNGQRECKYQTQNTQQDDDSK